MRHPVPETARPRWPRRPPWEAATIASSAVDVWALSLDRPPIPWLDLAQTLSPDEASRAGRFRFEIHRRRFATGRGLLRTLLGALLDVPAATLEFRYGDKGKPELVRDSTSPDLSFNLTHSADLALIAVSRDRDIGVDVEALRPLDDAEALAERFFAPAESEVFRALPAAGKLDGFYRYWTRKEAYVKARGDGLSLPTTAFAVDFEADRDARLLAFEEQPKELTRWRFEGLDPAPGFTGALAIQAVPEGTRSATASESRSPSLELRLWSW